jgi:formylglycine-generating enzyme required for sulfatase activity
MVRDDFWMAATRFFHDLEVPLLEGRNAAAVDLFDLRHARKVLAAFGGAYGCLPERPAPLTPDQERFLDQAVSGLAQGDRVMPIRLALFAEMIKGVAWSPALLKEMGGAEGVGVAFLEATFSAPTAPLKHRLHQGAVRAVLKLLLPTTPAPSRSEGTGDFKGHVQPRRELLQASGYDRRPEAFDELLRLLDTELRLVTPTDREGSVEPSYQLTHDYLVPVVRQWLSRKQRETWRGQAELCLEERANLWTDRPEQRHLPSWWEWIRIRLLTRRGDWTSPQRQMMRQATSCYVIRALILVACLQVLAVVCSAGYDHLQARALRDRLLDADTSDVPTIVAALAPYHRWADPLLEKAFREAEAAGDLRRQLHAALALLPEDDRQAEYLFGRLVNAEPQELVVIRDALFPYREQFTGRLWDIVAQPEKGHDGQRLRAACALSIYDPDNRCWDNVTRPVVKELVLVSPMHLDPWMKALAPIRDKLLGPLTTVFHDRSLERSVERNLATTILVDYAADRPEVLAELVLEADEKEFAALFPRLARYRGRVLGLLQPELDKALPAEEQVAGRDLLARRQAQAAVTLFRLGQSESVWPLLRHSSDPSRRSYLLHSLGRLGADPTALIGRLETEPDVSARRALVLALGEFGPEQLPESQRRPVEQLLLTWYRDHPDPGLHSAIDWLLRHNQRGPAPRKLDWGRKADLEQIDRELAGQPRGERNWYVSKTGQTLAVVSDPKPFRMGSPDHEPDRDRASEEGRLVQIPRPFAIATREVTGAQFRQFLQDHPRFAPSGGTENKYSPALEGPVNSVSWFKAAAYCNWLSQQEGLSPTEWCYPPWEQIKEGMTLDEGSLSRTGYRLPTEAEWEYACRAGTTTSRFFGSSEELLKEYAWYIGSTREERAWPVGQLKPNDLGLFDVYGNVYEWCQDAGIPAPMPAGGEVVDGGPRVARGGGLGNVAAKQRSAHRSLDRAARLDDFYLGFRVARTISR